MLTSMFIAGLGGQGVVTLAKLVATYASTEGRKVSLFNSKGMAQRGGRVTSEIRISDDPNAEFGSRISENGAEILIGMESGEAVNSLPFLKKDGLAVLLDYSFVPSPMILKKISYPGFSDIAARFAQKTEHLYEIHAAETPHNIFVLGVITALLAGNTSHSSNGEPIFRIQRDNMEQIIREQVKRRLDENLTVFNNGYQSVCNAASK